jgi:hypothetical protein
MSYQELLVLEGLSPSIRESIDMELQHFLSVLPKIATQPLAILAYICLVTAWLIRWFRKKQSVDFLKSLDALPSSQRANYARQAGYRYSELAQIPQKERIRVLNRRYFLYAYIVTILGVLLLILSIVVTYKESITSSWFSHSNGSETATSGGDFRVQDQGQGGQGNVNIRDSQIKDSHIEIYQGDPPAVRERKIATAKRVATDSILTNLSAIDARLSYIHTALQDDTFETELKAINDKLAPSAAQQLTGGYRQLVNQERISSLRLTMNSRPLKQGVDVTLLSTLREAHVDESRLKKFFDEQIPEVEQATEMLYRVLTEPGFTAANPSLGERAYAARRLAIQRKSLEIQSTYALLDGLDALHALGRQPDEVNVRLASLQNLTPRNLITQQEIAELRTQTKNRQEHMVEEKKQLLSEAGELLKEGTAALRAVENQLAIQPTDTWQAVVGKARSLRDFGRISDAVRAFDKYGQMFKDTDPTAMQYAETAKAFTQSIGRLDVTGGCYVFEVRANTPEAAAGFQVGDILIQLAGQPIPGMAELTKVYSEIKEEQVPLLLLRLNRTTGQFEHVNTTLRMGAIIRGVMPI